MCYRPINLKSGDQVPCGRCPKCRQRRINSWCFRLLQEYNCADTTSAHFLTLTYDNRSLFYSPNGYPSLRKDHLQRFFKRLRKAHDDDSKIKYYAVGEYGGITHRPHYHIIMFNAQTELIQPAWKNTWLDVDAGGVYFGSVTNDSIGYCLKYINKNKKAFRLSNDDDRIPEFAVMSNGLGISYLSETMCNWHAQDMVNRCFVQDKGFKQAMPRYYRDRIYYELEKAAIRAFVTEQYNEKAIEKLDKATTKSVWNEQQAIDAAFDKMYLSSFKQTL